MVLVGQQLLLEKQKGLKSKILDPILPVNKETTLRLEH
jgi:hypothetical protein